MPDPIPVAVLGRLAITQSHQRRGLGGALVSDAARRVVVAADIIGIRGVIVRALSAEAMAFYAALGFEPSKLRPMTLMATLADLRAALG
jgi:predicted N-acetyltransferase YhbS